MGLVQSLVELGAADRAATNNRDEACGPGTIPEPAAGAGAEPIAATPLDDRGVDFILGAVAIDRRAGRPGDHRTYASGHCAPYQPVDQRVFETFERGHSAGAISTSQSG